jgi:hypothetical protein
MAQDGNFPDIRKRQAADFFVRIFAFPDALGEPEFHA